MCTVTTASDGGDEDKDDPSNHNGYHNLIGGDSDGNDFLL